MDTQKENKESADLAVTKQAQVSMFLNEERFEFGYRIAKMLSISTMVPDHFRGNIGNCMIALNLAERLNMDVVGLMQTSYVVHGRPGFEAKLPIALFNARTKVFIPPIKWETKGDFPKGEDAACRAYAIDKETKEPLYGEWIDFNLVKGMGWLDKKGPDGTKESNMWRNMPGQMYRYRSASFFINVYEPGLKMGIQTVDELQDMVIDVTPQREIKIEPVEKPAKEPYKVKDIPQSVDGLLKQEFKDAKKLMKEQLDRYEEEGTEQSPKDSKRKPTAKDSIEKVVKTIKADLQAEIDTPPIGRLKMLMIYCPINGHKKHTDVCATNKCEKAAKCDPFKEWQHEQGVPKV